VLGIEHNDGPGIGWVEAVDVTDLSSLDDLAERIARSDWATDYSKENVNRVIAPAGEIVRQLHRALAEASEH